MQLGPMQCWEAHIGQHVGFGVVHQRGKLRQLRPELIGDGAPLRAGHGGIVLCEGGGDEGGDDASAALAGMGERTPHEVDAAALP